MIVAGSCLLPNSPNGQWPETERQQWITKRLSGGSRR